MSKIETKRGSGPGRQGKRRQFTDEFKAGAVRLVLGESKTVAQVARDLDLTPSALSGWVKQARADPNRRAVARVARPSDGDVDKPSTGVDQAQHRDATAVLRKPLWDRD